MSGTHIALAIAKKRARELEAELETLREDIEDWRKMAKEYATMWRILENLNLKATIPVSYTHLTLPTKA